MSVVESQLGQLIHDVPPHRVYTRGSWGEPWTLRPGLFCNWCQFESSPQTSAAELEYDYGQVLDGLAFVERPPLAIAGHWVKIEILAAADAASGPPGNIRWYGRCQEQAADLAGRVGDYVGQQFRRSPSGRQQFDCLGLEFELDRLFVVTSAIEGGGDIGRALDFNRGGGGRLAGDAPSRPNRSEGLGPNNTFVFARQLAGAHYWQADEIVEYLLAHHAQGELPWKLDTDSQLGFLKWYRPALPVHGMSLRQVLDALVDRRRLSAWSVRVWEQAGEPDSPRIYVYSLTPDPIASTLGNQILPANPYHKRLNFESAVDVGSALVVQSQLHAADSVRVVGARRTSTFSLFGAGGMQADWSHDEQLAYNDGASRRADYAALNASDKERLNDQDRTQPSVARVFSHFRLDPDWDGRVRNFAVSAGGLPLPASPALDDEGQPQEHVRAPFWRPGVRFDHRLRLVAGKDYSRGEPIAPPPLPGVPQSFEGELLAPFAVVVFDREQGAEAVRLDELASHSRDELEAHGGRDWAGSLRMRDDDAGFVITIRSPHQHRIGAGPSLDGNSGFKFTPLTGVQEIPAEVAWDHHLVVTVCWETDECVEVSRGGGGGREERIDLGEDYRLDYLCPYTVVGIEEGQLRYASKGGAIRDDRERMDALCQVAHEWYRRDRRAFSLTLRQVSGLFWVGDLITHVGHEGDAQEVNSAVTSIRYDLQQATQAIATDFGSLDVAAFGLRSARNG